MTPQLLINESPLQVLPTLARELGLNEGIVLQQVHYWLNLQFSRHLFEGLHWVRYTPEQWERQFSFWGPKTLRRAIHHLEKLEVLVSVTEDIGKVKYYTIDYWALNKVTSSFDSQAKGSRSPQTYDHANFDAINIDECKRENQ